MAWVFNHYCLNNYLDDIYSENKCLQMNHRPQLDKISFK